jgi:hypothetical protein
MYLLDIVRSSPNDLNYAPDPLALFRPEFMSEYMGHVRAKKRLQLRQLQKQQAGRKLREPSAPDPIKDEDIDKILGYVL